MAGVGQIGAPGAGVSPFRTRRVDSHRTSDDAWVLQPDYERPRRVRPARRRPRRRGGRRTLLLLLCTAAACWAGWRATHHGRGGRPAIVRTVPKQSPGEPRPLKPLQARDPFRKPGEQTASRVIAEKPSSRESATPEHPHRWRTVIATAYDAPCPFCRTGAVTATGRSARHPGAAVAARASFRAAPLGSRVEVRGGMRLVDDTLRGAGRNRVNLRMRTHREALRWGRREIRLRVLE
jgi:3D (Asp-Asp-Asp) domain-containing protein